MKSDQEQTQHRCRDRMKSSGRFGNGAFGGPKLAFDRERDREETKKKEGIVKTREMQEKLWLHRAVSNRTVFNSHSYVV